MTIPSFYLELQSRHPISDPFDILSIIAKEDGSGVVSFASAISKLGRVNVHYTGNVFDGCAVYVTYLKPPVSSASPRDI